MALRLRLPNKATNALYMRTICLNDHHAATPLFLPQFLDWAVAPRPGGQQDFCHQILIVPTQFTQEDMARGRLSLLDFHTTLIQPHLTEAEFLVNYAGQVRWWMTATMDCATPGNLLAEDHSMLELDVSKDGSYAGSHLAQVCHRRCPLLEPRLCTGLHQRPHVREPDGAHAVILQLAWLRQAQ
mgnify:CR=1 FL=1